MSKIAFVFSGQGDQYPGMGKDLCDQYDAAREVFQQCDRIRPGTMEQCFTGTQEELKETKNTQPCLFAMELAAYRVLTQKGICADAMAGFSLGEVVAATAAGYFDAETGFSLVCKRGALMQEAAGQVDTAMAAVLKLSCEQVTELCSRYTGVYPVNFNCPGQISVSALASHMPAFCADVKAAGGRALPLKVKGGFHSPFMREASASFAQELKKVVFHNPSAILYSNLTAKPYEGDIADLLSRQICNPVLWENTIRNMVAAGIDTFIEIGPGRTLTNMIKKIDPAVAAMTVTEYLSEE